jgi:NTP pyrophosphatase (non-canonical NTP hydrolase)
LRNKKRYAVYEEAMKQWGKEAQAITLFEEIGELMKAVSKLYRDDNPDTYKALVEEIADVEIMLEQLRVIVPVVEGDVEAAKEEALERLKRKVRGTVRG